MPAAASRPVGDVLPARNRSRSDGAFRAADGAGVDFSGATASAVHDGTAAGSDGKIRGTAPATTIADTRVATLPGDEWSELGRRWACVLLDDSELANHHYCC